MISKQRTQKAEQHFLFSQDFIMFKKENEKTSSGEEKEKYRFIFKHLYTFLFIYD